MKTFSALLLLVQLGLFFSCQDKKNSTVYENCCGTEPTVDTVHMVIRWTDWQGSTFDTAVVGRVYIPNIFTPTDNSWSENSNFLLFGNEYVNRVISAKYFSESGELLYAKENFLPNDPSFGWSGVRTDGSIYKGGFEYKMVVEYIDGRMKTYAGQACAYQCGDNGFPADQLPDCLFPSQNSGIGSPDPTLPQPNDCF